MNFGEWVLAARKGKGWTQARMADALGITKACVSVWEHGRSEPSLRMIEQIANLCGADPTMLFPRWREAAHTDRAAEPWPFEFPLARFQILPQRKRDQIAGYIAGVIGEVESSARWKPVLLAREYHK